MRSDVPAIAIPLERLDPVALPRRHVGIRVFRSIGAVRQAGLSAAQHTNAFDAQHDALLLQGLKEFGVDPGGPAERVDLDVSAVYVRAKASISPLFSASPLGMNGFDFPSRL